MAVESAAMSAAVVNRPTHGIRFRRASFIFLSSRAKHHDLAEACQSLKAYRGEGKTDLPRRLIRSPCQRGARSVGGIARPSVFAVVERSRRTFRSSNRINSTLLSIFYPSFSITGDGCDHGRTHAHRPHPGLQQGTAQA